MKKIIALTLLLMFLISSACIASPYVAYTDTGENLLAFDFEGFMRATEEYEQETYRKAREERQQEQESLDKWREEEKAFFEERNKQRFSGLDEYQRPIEQEQGLGIDFDKLRSELKEENRQRFSGLNQYQQTKEQEQEIAIRVEQARQERQKIFLLLGIASIILLAILFIKRKAICRWILATYKTITPLQISQIFLIGFLLTIATMPSWRISDGIYTLLRILTTTISVWSAIKTDNNILRLIFAFIAILFNPIILIKLDRDEWEMIDVATAFFYLGIVVYSLIKAKKKQD